MSENTNINTMGVYGGTFDPIHHGHLQLAEDAAWSLALDQVRFLPTGVPPHRAQPNASAKDRLEMVRLAITGNKKFVLDPLECRSKQPSYAILTLKRLQRAYPDTTLVLLLGVDAFIQLPTWHCWREIMSIAHIAVAARPGFEMVPEQWSLELADEYRNRFVVDASAAIKQSKAGKLFTVDNSLHEASSTDVRNWLAHKRSVRYILPQSVHAYISRHALYQAVTTTLE